MIPSIRKQYNTRFNEATYQAFLNDLDTEFDSPIPFRQSESPIFLSDEFRDKLIEAGNEIAEMVLAPDFYPKSDAAIPKDLYVPNDPGFPGMLAIDFAFCKDEKGEWIPQLIEMQGFPSLYGYQIFLSQMYKKHFYSPKGFTYLFGGMRLVDYKKRLKGWILNGHKPENVVLLEIEPMKQKTSIDFVVTEAWTGIQSICISEVIREGRKLFYLNKGKKTPIHRIYNRVIFDELLPRTDLARNYNLTEEVDVEWVCHPNWFFRISKYTLPHLTSRYIPTTRFLSDLTTYPTDLENYVLKPLFSFAGQGVIINVTPQDIENVKDPENWILQKKVTYEFAYHDPEGVGVKAEVRLLFLYNPDKQRCELVATLGRQSKGLMVGVRYNKDFKWVGASAYFWRKK
jgi:hypothetical protein